MRRAHRRTTVASTGPLVDPYVLELACKAYLFGMSGDAVGVHETVEVAQTAGIAREQLFTALDTIATLPVRSEEALDEFVHRQYMRDAQLRPDTLTAASA